MKNITNIRNLDKKSMRAISGGCMTGANSHPIVVCLAADALPESMPTGCNTAAGSYGQLPNGKYFYCALAVEDPASFIFLAGKYSGAGYCALHDTIHIDNGDVAGIAFITAVGVNTSPGVTSNAFSKC